MIEKNSNNLNPKEYNCKILEGNWYEERCTTTFDKTIRRNFALENPNNWQYERTYQEIGVENKNFPKIQVILINTLIS